MREQLTSFYEQLKARDLKLTPARRILGELLVEYPERLFTALDLYEYVKSRSPKINFSTVYRNLELLVDYGLVEKIIFPGGAKFKRLASVHRHHLICSSCHTTQPLPYCPLGELEKAVKDHSDFLPLEHKIEVYGICKQCREQKPREI